MKKISIAAVLLGLCLGLAAQAEMISNLSANAVAYYSFDNESDPGHDDSGNGNNLAVYGAAPTYTSAGWTNGATSFDGTSGWSVGNMFTTPSFTIAAFVQFDESSAEACKMIVSAYQKNIQISRYETMLTIYTATFDEANNASYTATTTALENGAGWYHLAMSFEATSGPDANGVYTGTIKTYVNGVLENTKTDAEYCPTENPMYLGRYSTSAMTGLMDEVYVFDGALSGSEVARLSGRDLPPHLVAYYSFDDENNLGHDDSENGNNLVLYTALPTYSAAGKVGGATVFDGTSGWKANTMFTTPSFTIAAFVQFDENCPATAKMFSSGYGKNVLFSRLSSFVTYNATYDEAGHASVVNSTTALDNGAGWYHIAMSFDAESGPDANGVYTGTIKAYVNGALENTMANAEYAPITTYMLLGRGSSSPMTGLMDEVYVFDEALTDQKVAQLAGFSIPDHLVARWTFDDPNDRGFDSAFNGHTLIMMGGSGLSYAPGRVGDAVHLTTNGCEFKVADVLGPTVTVAGFFKADADNDENDRFFSYDPDTGGLSAYTVGNQIRFMTRYSTDFTYQPTSINHVPGGGWQHIAMSFTPDGAADGNGDYTGTMKGYVNGLLAVTDTNAIYNPNSELRMSTWSASYRGMMDEINVFDTALTDSEIYDLSLRIPGYDGWAEQYGGTNVIGAATNDYDGDGLINLYEYALGGNPTNALDTGTSPQFGTVEQGGATYFGYVYPQVAAADSGLTYSLETSTNLVSGTWTNAGYTVLGTNVTGNTLNMVSNYTDTVDSQKFIRLMISTNTP